jgi:hypothetical protein
MMKRMIVFFVLLAALAAAAFTATTGTTVKPWYTKRVFDGVTGFYGDPVDGIDVLNLKGKEFGIGIFAYANFSPFKLVGEVVGYRNLQINYLLDVTKPVVMTSQDQVEVYAWQSANVPQFLNLRWIDQHGTQWNFTFNLSPLTYDPQILMHWEGFSSTDLALFDQGHGARVFYKLPNGHECAVGISGSILSKVY